MTHPWPQPMPPNPAPVPPDPAAVPCYVPVIAFHSCDFVEEVRLADCDAGCKVRKCTGCFRESAVHLNPCDGWRTLNGPSLASIHRRWLDQGLPAHTWAQYVNRGGWVL